MTASKPPQSPLVGEARSQSADIRRYFDEISVGRNETIEANPIICYEQELRAETVLTSLAANAGERILDIGCGNARDIARMVECGAEVVGVDISDGMVKAARQDLDRLGVTGVTLQVGDATRLDFADGSFDKILCSEVIEHIPDARLALSEMWRVLKPGGRLVLSTPNKASWYGVERYLLLQALLRRKWNHPCDEWRTVADLVSLTEAGRFKVCDRKSVCFVPGFIVTYFLLPNKLQSILIKCIRHIEPRLRRWFPARGYTICIVAARGAE